MNRHRVHCTRKPISAGLCLLVALLLRTPNGTAAETLPQPGPELDGLRLRLVIEPARQSAGGHDVRIDLINVSSQPITLRTNWERPASDSVSGSVTDYLEAATSIESFPPFQPWRGGQRIVAGDDPPPQDEQVLPAGQTLTVRWQTGGPQLKNRVSDPGVVQNPTFTLPGLYSVHANLVVVTSKGTRWLRSNEQLVSFGGSQAMPKHTFGPVLSINAEKKTALLGLGSQHQVEVGDRFEITSKLAAWQLIITEVRPHFSEAKLELLSGDPTPPRDASATLVEQ